MFRYQYLVEIYSDCAEKIIINARVNEGAIDTDKIGMNTPETLATLDTQDTGRNNRLAHQANLVEINNTP
jgi:hypothetical protein